MNEGNFTLFLVLSGLVAAAIVFVALFFVSAPYGRHIRRGWGPLISNQLGWTLMESPAAVMFAACFAVGSVPKNLPLMLFLFFWELHYIHRALIYPLTIRDGSKKMPLGVVLMGFGFNLGNAYANGRYLFSLSGGYALEWLQDPRFITGAVLFVIGIITNRWADTILRSLREPGEAGYRIPKGGLFRWVSCPNYLGEIIEWLGWALATWSLPGAAFALWTIANLAPQHGAHHRWYRQQFSNYPTERKALVPGIW